MIKHFIIQWYEVERVQALEQLRKLSEDLKNYSARADAKPYAIEKQKEQIRNQARFIDQTTKYMEAISNSFQNELNEQFRRGMDYAKSLPIEKMDKYGQDKEWIRIQSILRLNDSDL